MKTFVKSGLVALCLGASVSCSDKQEIKEPGPVTIFLGENKWMGCEGGFVNYNGMTGDNQRFLLSSFTHDAVNIYYPIQNKQINFEVNLNIYKFKVNFVTPDSISLTYLGKTDKK